MNLLRALSIARVCARYRLDNLLPQHPAMLLVKVLVALNPRCWSVCEHFSRGARLRLALETLGPIYIKFGQILSTRRDLLPDDIADELAKLQDQVPPFASDVAIAIIEKAYKKPVNEIFSNFDPEPLASASIAQVHTAVLPNGEDVVLKIVRPNIAKAVNKNIKFLYGAAKTLQRVWPDARRLRPVEVVAEFEKTLHHELDMVREAANASQLRRNFLDSDIIYVPKVYFDYTVKNIMVMERIYGTKVSDVETLNRHNVDLERLARNGVEIFMTQVFRDSFFHADMHPGNVLVDLTNPEKAKYCAIDFGIVGSLSDDDQRYLAENFLAFFQHDYKRIAQLHIESLWVPENTNVEDLTSAIRCVCEPIFQKPMSEISFGMVLLRLFQVAREFDMQIQPQLILLQKTLLNIEGLGRQLYPDLDLWDTVYPFLKKWAKEKYSLSSLLQRFKAEMPFILEKLPEMPSVVYEFLQQKVESSRTK
jgi:ubiquinone biosynthesis protein